MNHKFRFHFLYLTLFFTFFQYNSFAQDSTASVLAKKGDGIYSLLRNQGMNPYQYYDQFIE